MNNYKTLHYSLVKDFKGKDFVLINKRLKYSRLYKCCIPASFATLGASLIPQFSDNKFTIAIIGIAGILFFETKVRNIKELLHDSNDLEDIFKKYLNSTELIEFRKFKLNELECKSLTRRDYLILVKEELQLIFNLIKAECENDSRVDVVTYKNDVKNVFEILSIALDKNLITKEDFKVLEKKWLSDIQVLCNQYNKTELEIDLKYLQRLHNIKE